MVEPFFVALKIDHHWRSRRPGTVAELIDMACWEYAAVAIHNLLAFILKGLCVGFGCYPYRTKSSISGYPHWARSKTRRFIAALAGKLDADLLLGARRVAEIGKRGSTVSE